MESKKTGYGKEYIHIKNIKIGWDLLGILFVLLALHWTLWTPAVVALYWPIRLLLLCGIGMAAAVLTMVCRALFWYCVRFFKINL